MPTHRFRPQYELVFLDGEGKPLEANFRISGQLQNNGIPRELQFMELAASLSAYGVHGYRTHLLSQHEVKEIAGDTLKQRAAAIWDSVLERAGVGVDAYASGLYHLIDGEAVAG